MYYVLQNVFTQVPPLKIPCIPVTVSHSQVWDRRYSDHCLKTIPGHNGPVYCCNWHPEVEHCILSAGRDKLIKVRSISLIQQFEFEIG